VPYPDPSPIRFPSTETYLAATTTEITVTATLADRRWSVTPATTRRWAAALGSQP
jgi:hypothetical protein